VRKKKLIPELNDNELIKRLGLLSTDDDSASNEEIPASRVENHIPENVDNDIVSNKKDDIAQPDFTENIFESWSKRIPAKIKNSINTITSEFINGTQQVKDRLEKARNSLVDNFKQAFSVPEAEIKEPKKESDSSNPDFFEKILDNPFSKFFESFNIQEKISSFYSKLYFKTM